MRYVELVAGAVLYTAGALLDPMLPSAAALADAEAVDVASAETVATPIPRPSGGTLPPLLPPAGLPTAPPPDAIKPVEPQAGPGHPELEPVDTRHDGGG